jgi:hypothetical protein
MSRRLSKKALDEGDEVQGELPDGQGGAVVRGRSPFGFVGLKPIVLRKIWSPIGPRPLVKVHQRYEWTYLLGLRPPQQRRGPLAHLAHRKG